MAHFQPRKRRFYGLYQRDNPDCHGGQQRHDYGPPIPHRYWNHFRDGDYCLGYWYRWNRHLHGQPFPNRVSRNNDFCCGRRSVHCDHCRNNPHGIRSRKRDNLPWSNLTRCWHHGRHNHQGIGHRNWWDRYLHNQHRPHNRHWHHNVCAELQRIAKFGRRV